MTQKFEKICKSSARAGEKNDCTVKALAIACRVSYKKAHEACAWAGRKPGRGLDTANITWAAKRLGCTLKYEHPRIGGRRYGKKYTMKTIGAVLNKGYWVVVTAGHAAAVVNGVVEDWTAGRKHQVVHAFQMTVPRGSRS